MLWQAARGGISANAIATAVGRKSFRLIAGVSCFQRSYEDSAVLAAFHLLMMGIGMINAFKRASRLIPCCAVSVVLLAACASSNSGGGSVSDPTRMTRSGFLSDYEKLAPVAGTGGIQCWRDAAVDLKKFNKVLIARMVVTLKDGESKGIDPTDLKTLTDYFHGSLVKAIQPQMPVVDQLGPDVLVIRIALTDLVPTNVALSVAGTAIPFGYVADAGAGVATGRPAGATPYMGQTGIEMQFRDGGTNAIVAECRDSEVGRKYAVDMNAGVSGAAETWANGYMNSFQSWSYAKDAFDKWSALTAKRLGELRGVKVAAK